MKFVKIPGKDFEMQDAPVTQQEWWEIMGTTPSYFKDKHNNPVESVSFNDCEEFIKKLNSVHLDYVYRLPTEEEWEYCASYGLVQCILDCAWVWENSNISTQPVKTKEPNKYGLYDMLGNVWEWTSTESGSNRVVRGGGWNNIAQNVRSAIRYYDSSGYHYNVVGFRLVRTPSKPLTLDRETRALAVATEALEQIKKILEDG